MENYFCEPRMPDQREISQLILFQCEQGNEWEVATGQVLEAYIAVFDERMTISLVYTRKVMVVVWSDGPSFYGPSGFIVGRGRDRHSRRRSLF